MWPQWTLELWDERSQEQVDRSRGALPPQHIDAERARRSYVERLDRHWLRYVQSPQGAPSMSAQRYRELRAVWLEGV